ncbi:MAG TPA: hypothetical protein VKH43_08635 [Thermoanaerobaculia bacterium]|nr:hypothetical protein [Thermoanaerobaculia bacterium]
MLFRTLRIAAIGLLLAAGASGQSGTWVSRGPDGGNVYCLTPDPSRPGTLYAGTDYGVYKSVDGGATWQVSNSGLSVYRVQTIAIDPTSSNTLLAGTITPDGVPSVGIFKSTDGGATWSESSAGLFDSFTGIAPLDIDVLTYDPKKPGTVWAGSRYSEIFQSADGGASWAARTAGGYSLGLETSSFVIDPANSSTVLAATNNGLVRTTDGGSSWSFYGNAGVSFYTLAADPSNAQVLYAGNTSGSGMYKSTDAGAHWSSINKGLPTNQISGNSSLPLITSFAIDPTNTATVYATTYGNGLFKSTDGGANWALAPGSMRSNYIWSILVASGQPSAVYVGTAGAGAYRSADSGATFTAINTGLRLSVVNGLVADAASPATFYAGNFDGIYRSTDGGGSWQPYGSGLPVVPILALASRSGTPQTLFAGTRGTGVYKSSDGGATWTASSQGLADSYVSAVAVDPSATSTLYAGTSHPYTGSNSQRVYKSADGGATWTQTSLDAQGFSITSISVNAAKSSQVIAVSAGATGYFQSLDAGKTWNPVNSDVNCGGVNAVFFDASGATTYIAGTSGLCRSADGGKTWTLSTVDVLASVRTLWIDPVNPSRMYAGAEPAIPEGTGGVFKSTDGGQTWQPVGTGLETAAVRSLQVNSATGNFLAGTRGSGIAQLLAQQDRQSVQRPTSSDRETHILRPR